MRTLLTRERLSSALAAELGAALGRRVDERVHINTAEHWGEASCIATMSVGGRARGGITVWIDREALVSLGDRVGLGATPDAQALVDVTASLVHDALTGLQAQSGFTTLAFGAVGVTMAPTAERAPLVAMVITLASGARCAIAVGADIDLQADPEDERLETVLDFDLPIVVRFGRSVMPLKTLAALGPGAMVDLGRSPDQPVEIVMGEKVLALGEVVVVGGNYGVRVTELTSNKASLRAALGGHA
jgi:flagellar motor switch protein FliN